MTLQSWVNNHDADYVAVRIRLARTRDALLHGSVSDAAGMLQRAYDFAVLSIRTERERHERAFTGLYAGKLTRKEAALETVYGGHKKSWMARTHDATDWTVLAEAVRAHARAGRWTTLLDAVVDSLTGVSYRKASFMLAMCGLTEYGCIDSNVARYAGETVAHDDEFYSAESYMETCRGVFAAVPTGWDPFVKQWAIYDYERGEHARHMAFFRELPVEY